MGEEKMDCENNNNDKVTENELKEVGCFSCFQVKRSKNLHFQAFGLFDLDKDGMISVMEMKRLVERVGGSMSEPQVRAIISKVDTDNNGLIDFTEFRGLWAVVTGDLEVNKDILLFKRDDLLLQHAGRDRNQGGFQEV